MPRTDSGIEAKFSDNYQFFGTVGCSIDSTLTQDQIQGLVTGLELAKSSLKSRQIYVSGEDLSVTLGKILKQLQNRYDPALGVEGA